jgi:cytochrome c-type biogenesis protein CcmE
MKPVTNAWPSPAGVLVAMGAPPALVLNAFQSNLVFFFRRRRSARKEAPAGPHLPPRRPGGAGQRQARRA